MLAGNLSYAFKSHNISWRAAPLGLAVAAFLVAIAIAVLIREPVKGRFIVNKVWTFPPEAHCQRSEALPPAISHRAPGAVCRVVTG